MPLSDIEQQALAALDKVGLISTVRELLRIPSITGHEAEAQRWLAERMCESGLEVDLWPIDVAELRQHPDFPGMEVARDGHDALGLVGTWSGNTSGKRLIFNGHIDVVPEGAHTNWQHAPWAAEQDDEYIYGRGACDMKSGLIAAFYAIKVIRSSDIPVQGSLMLQSVIGEEDGGLGTFATILRGYTGDAAIICEPTRLNLVPANAGALTFTMRVVGKAAHASERLAGVSAIEKYLDIHRALLQLERARNSHVEHPLLSKFQLPYPLSIGRVQAGNWSSTVPEELVCEGRLGVAMGESTQAARTQFEQTVRAVAEADPWLKDHPVEIAWTGGQFDSAEIPLEHPLIRLCSQCMQDLTGQLPAIHGEAYGSDLRLLIKHGHIPALLLGPGDVLMAHMPDERIRTAEIIQAAQLYILAALRYLCT